MAENSLFELLVVLAVFAAIAVFFWYATTQKGKPAKSTAYQEALEYLAEGNDRMAIQKFKEAVREDSENISAYLRLGDLLRKKGMLANAIRIHKDLTLRGNLSAHQKAQIFKSLLLDYELANDYTEAIAAAKKLLETDPQPEPGVVQKLLQMLEKKQDWRAAEETANKFSHILPPSFKSRLALYIVFQGLELQEKGSGKEARIRFKEALKKDPECVAAYYYLGKSYQSEERLDDAIKAWKRLCEASPDKSFVVYPELEKAWYELGRFADAENLYSEQLNKSKKGLKAGLALAEIYNKKGEYDIALEILNRLEAEYHATPVLISKKISVYYNKGQYKQAATQSLAVLENLGGFGNAVYTCKVCQHKSVAPTWMCEKCQALDSYDI